MMYIRTGDSATIVIRRVLRRAEIPVVLGVDFHIGEHAHQFAHVVGWHSRLLWMNNSSMRIVQNKGALADD